MHHIKLNAFYSGNQSVAIDTMRLPGWRADALPSCVEGDKERRTRRDKKRTVIAADGHQAGTSGATGGAKRPPTFPGCHKVGDPLPLGTVRRTSIKTMWVGFNYTLTRNDVRSQPGAAGPPCLGHSRSGGARNSSKECYTFSGQAWSFWSASACPRGPATNRASATAGAGRQYWLDGFMRSGEKLF